MNSKEVLIPASIKKKIKQLNYELREQFEEKGNGINYSYVKEIEDYIIELSLFYPFHEEDGIYVEMQLFEGTIGNQPPYINSKGEVDFHMGQECIIATSRDENELISNINKWDREAIKKANYFIDKTEGFETSTMRQFGMSGNMGKLFDMISDSKEIGRNDPCPCGSGKKYKKCCMN